MNALIAIAHGSESLEAVAVVNVLRRADVAVTVASVEQQLRVDGTRGIPLMADVRFDDVADQEFDAIVLPGGEKGAERLAQCKPLIERLRAQRIAHKWYGAICAAPAITLSPHGLLDGKQATCYPAFRDKLLHYVDRDVVVDGHCVTSQGPGTALRFGLKLVEALCGVEKARAVGAQMLVS